MFIPVVFSLCYVALYQRRNWKVRGSQREYNRHNFFRNFLVKKKIFTLKHGSPRCGPYEGKSFYANAFNSCSLIKFLWQLKRMTKEWRFSGIEDILFWKSTIFFYGYLRTKVIIFDKLPHFFHQKKPGINK